MKFTITVGIAYMNQGFVNIRQRYSEYFGEDNSEIKVYLGSWESKSLINSAQNNCYINRRANPNGTPRIMMGAIFTRWMAENHQIADLLVVEILTDSYPTNSILIK